MREEYDIENLNPGKNPYSNRLKTINTDNSTIEYLKSQSESSDISNPASDLSTFTCSEVAANDDGDLQDAHPMAGS